jgi:hypothetical protein
MALDLSAGGLKAFLLERIPYQLHVCLAFHSPKLVDGESNADFSRSRKFSTRFFLLSRL